jgi:ribosomal protein S18 acetylase RimI-like enzyme
MTVTQFSTYIKRKYPVYVFLYEKKNDAYRRKIVTLSIINVAQGYRRQGIGSKVMAELINFADNNKIILVLTPATDYGMSKTALSKFYKSFGFKKNNDTSITGAMIRNPK